MTSLDTNKLVLQQGIDLLSILTDEAFSQKHAFCFHSSIGAHFRHNVEHYQLFLTGYQDQPIDYDQRARNERLETDCLFCLQAMKDIQSALDDFFVEDPQQVLSITCTASSDIPPFTTSLERGLTRRHSGTANVPSISTNVSCRRILAACDL